MNTWRQTEREIKQRHLSSESAFSHWALGLLANSSQLPHSSPEDCSFPWAWWDRYHLPPCRKCCRRRSLWWLSFHLCLTCGTSVRLLTNPRRRPAAFEWWCGLWLWWDREERRSSRRWWDTDSNARGALKKGREIEEENLSFGGARKRLKSLCWVVISFNLSESINWNCWKMLLSTKTSLSLGFSQKSV